MSLIRHDCATTALAALRRARVLLDKRHRWVQSYEATDRDGNPTTAAEGDAYAYCLAGALERVTSAGDGAPECDVDAAADAFLAAIDVLARACHAFGRGRVMDRCERALAAVQGFNDHYFTRHADVLAVLDVAIEAADAASREVV